MVIHAMMTSENGKGFRVAGPLSRESPVDSPNKKPGGCFTNVSQAPQNILAKIHNTRNHIYGENFNLKICTCAQSMALGTRTKFQLEILIQSTNSAIHKFQENILESSRNVSETTPSNAGFEVFFYVSLNIRLNNRRGAGDLRLKDVHCDVTVMAVIMWQ